MFQLYKYTIHIKNPTHEIKTLAQGDAKEENYDLFK